MTEDLGKKNKLGKFLDNKQSKNVIEYGKPEFEKIKGNWSSHFKNENELVIELACGWGEYTVSLAEKFPTKNFIGIDIKGDRIWKGSQYARENKPAQCCISEDLYKSSWRSFFRRRG